MGDNSITCSFGEFFAGVNDGISGTTYTDFVLACERAVLVRNGVTGDTLEEKIREADERIKHVALRMHPQDKISKNQIRGAEIISDASSDGQQSKNVELVERRSETLKKYLKTLSVFGADKNGKTPGISIPTNEPSDKTMEKDESISISDLTSKKGRNSKIRIIVSVGEEKYNPNSVLAGESISAENTNSSEFKEEQGKYRRYDDERLFFQMLKENDDIAYANLIEKVKFFSPAYHSVTPEGFNARLTFLQQCTRQGPTVTSSDLGTKDTAANLAFGRAPFCILRLGDFLNTKVVVKSVNITYPDSMWDLNPDGIGAQFMMAKVQMNIDIIGGSDISAPIKRLQNAVSFNYYANTSIYDNRSDISVYDGNGGAIDTRSWSPELKSKK